MPLTYYGEQSVAFPSLFGAVAVPGTYWFGLQTTSIWSASTSISAGQFIIPTIFDTFTTSGT